MGRWTQYDEDKYRLPEGIVRVGYDADTQQHTFLDQSSGELYRGEPGARYGVMCPVSDLPPHLFSDSNRRQRPPPIMTTTDPCSSPRSFAEFVPAELIASPTTSETSQSPFSFSLLRRTKSQDSSPQRLPRLFQTARRATVLPRMRAVVHTLRRSLTVSGKSPDGNIGMLPHARRATLPSMQRVVHSLPRSLSRSLSLSEHSPDEKTEESDEESLQSGSEKA